MSWSYNPFNQFNNFDNFNNYVASSPGSVNFYLGEPNSSNGGTITGYENTGEDLSTGVTYNDTNSWTEYYYQQYYGGSGYYYTNNGAPPNVSSFQFTAVNSPVPAYDQIYLNLAGSTEFSLSGNQVLLTSSNQVFATFSAANGQLTVTIASGFYQSYQQIADLIHAVYYENTSSNPPFSQQINFTVNSSAGSGVQSSVTVDVVPNAPVIAAIVNTTGGSGSNITDHAQAEVSGTADPGNMVEIFADGGSTAIGSGLTDQNGHFDITTSTLSDGAHSLTATAVDGAQVASAASSAFQVTIDTDAGEQPTLAFADLAIGPSGASSVHFSVGGLDTDDSGTVTFTDQLGSQVSTPVSANGTFTADLHTLSDGPISASLALGDTAGNHFSASSSNTAQLDQDLGEQKALAVMVNGGNPVGSAIIAAVPLTVTGVEGDDNGSVTFSDGVNTPVVVTIANGQLSPSVNLTGLNDGTISVTLHLNSDAIGNAFQDVTTSATISTIPPQLSFVPNQTLEATGPNGATAAFSATASDPLDGSDPVVFKDGSTVVHSGDTFSLSTGSRATTHTITASATDAAGNTASETFTITVQDTTPPQLSAVADQTDLANGVNGAAASFSVTATDLVDGNDPVVFKEGSTVVHSGDTFSLGTHTITASATDAAGNTSSESFTVKVMAAPGSAPDLAAYVALGVSTLAAGGTVATDLYDLNLGRTAAPASTTGLYLSTDPVIDSGDTLLATRTVGPLPASGSTGSYDHQSFALTLPSNLAPGTYYVGAFSDYNNQIAESNETNNTYNAMKIAVAQPDLTDYVSLDNTSLSAGAGATLTAGAINLGPVASPGSTAGIYLSTDSVIDSSDTLLTTIGSPGLAATSKTAKTGFFDSQTVTVTLPGNIAPGTYYIGGIADYDNQIAESNEGNNNYNAVKITVGQPDLTDYVSLASTALSAGASTTVTAAAINLGAFASPGSAADIYLSTDPTIDSSDTLLATVTSPGLAGMSKNAKTGFFDSQSVAVTLPGNIAPGTYYIGGIADYNDQIAESNESNNNYNAVKITVGLPDLTEYVSLASTALSAGATTTVAAAAINLGAFASPGSTAGIYLSTIPMIDGSGTLLTTVTSPGLAAMSKNATTGFFDSQSVAVTLPGNLTPGTYYIGGIADYNKQIAESDESNNNFNAVKITIGQPDLTDYVSLASTSLTAGGSATVTAAAINLGKFASAGSTAGIFLSTDSIIDTADTLLTTATSPGLAAMSQGKNDFYDVEKVTVTLPGKLAPGTYYIGGIADYGGQIAETNESNNNYNAVKVTVAAAPQGSAGQSSDAGPITIEAGATAEIAGPSTQAVTFAASTGTLKLDDSSGFAGTVAGLSGGDTIDLADVDPAAVHAPSYSGDSSGGTLSVSYGAHSANIALIGNYLAATFTVSSDGHGGTSVVEATPASNGPPLAQPHS